MIHPFVHFVLFETAFYLDILQVRYCLRAAVSVLASVFAVTLDEIDVPLHRSLAFPRQNAFLHLDIAGTSWPCIPLLSQPCGLLRAVSANAV